MKGILSLAAVFLLSGAVRADGTWVVESSTLTYTADHKLHGSRGTSHAARGKALCSEGGCDFLAAAPVNSFFSGDTNRDLHMIETTRGAQFPMVTVSGHLPAFPQGDFTADLEVEFSGKKASYRAVPFHGTVQGDVFSFSGAVPATLSDFNIPAPSLLGIAIKNDIPVSVSLTWRQQP